ncbi:reticulocalbin-3 isoform X3 [Alexandromys fortis]|uniref:reticulocalbin-3 isoform X3 n=1 Tax=Alexandromys fortis TaxID=100897 RepID=UPI00215232F6|nr:reticulocalbin-3 isoform X3 [Microtus fortis]
MGECSLLYSRGLFGLLSSFVLFCFVFLFVCFFPDRISLGNPGHPGWNWLCRPRWPQAQRSACLCILSAGIKGLRHHTQDHQPSGGPTRSRPGEEFHDVEDAETYKKMLARDERRFRVADQDGDSMATREELTAFLHPEEFPHMRDIVVAVSEETLEDLDRNKDGYVQVEEYIADLYSEVPGEEEPAWVQTERQQFRDFRDLNKDGKLDGSEVGYWVLPPSQDQPLVEANHLLHESDTDKDGRLSKAEILSNWNMFVGSQATNYGEDLTRHHDEL